MNRLQPFDKTREQYKVSYLAQANSQYSIT